MLRSWLLRAMPGLLLLVCSHGCVRLTGSAGKGNRGPGDAGRDGDLDPVVVHDSGNGTGDITGHDTTSPDSSPCTGGGSFLQSSKAEPQGEHTFRVEPALSSCVFRFQVNGAGGGWANGSARGGHGGHNSFDFVPGQPGLLIMVVGGGGTGTSKHRDGGSGGGASSVIFDPDAQPDRSDAFELSIAGGGGGEGGSVGGSKAGDGGDGNGDGKGATGGGGGFGSYGTGKGICSIWGDCCGGSCKAGVVCQGGAGGTGAGNTGGGVPGGFGKGGGHGGHAAFGAGGGGGYGGAAGSRYNGAGGGGGGEVFPVQPPAQLVNTTDPAKRLGGGGRGGTSNSPTGQDGSIVFSIGAGPP